MSIVGDKGGELRATRFDPHRRLNYRQANKHCGVQLKHSLGPALRRLDADWNVTEVTGKRAQEPLST